MSVRTLVSECRVFVRAEAALNEDPASRSQSWLQPIISIYERAFRPTLGFRNAWPPQDMVAQAGLSMQLQSDTHCCACPLPLLAHSNTTPAALILSPVSYLSHISPLSLHSLALAAVASPLFRALSLSLSPSRLDSGLTASACLSSSSSPSTQGYSVSCQRRSTISSTWANLRPDPAAAGPSGSHLPLPPKGRRCAASPPRPACDRSRRGRSCTPRGWKGGEEPAGLSAERGCN